MASAAILSMAPVVEPASVCVVMNGGSGKRRAHEKVDQIREAFARQGREITVRLIEGGDIEGATRRACAEGHGIIVAAGGDGTICGVASALNGNVCTMGILPLGTFNYFARSLELPLDDLDAAVEVICSGREVPLRIAMVNDRVFLNNASLGVYPRILETREDVYGRWGRSQVAAYWSVLKTLLSLRRPLELWIQADGAERRLRTPLLFVVNNAYQLDSIGIAGADKIADGHLVALIAPDTGRLGMIRHALSLALGGAVPGTTYEMISASDLKVSVTGATRRLRSVARDGERDTMAAPFHMRVVEEALTVMVPKDWHAETR